MANRCPRIAITPGEPAGAGPDIAIKLAVETIDAELVYIASPSLLESRAKQLGKNIIIEEFNPSDSSSISPPNTLKVLPVDLNSDVKVGELSPKNAHYVLETLTTAAEGCLDKTFDAMTTGPVQKSIINDAGHTFSGHTEYLAELCNNAYPVMMLANNQVRVALVTTHLPLNQVSSSINKTIIKQTVEIVNNDLKQWFGIKHPKILVCGLNPHAGEQGHLGMEEIEIIEPALKALEGINIQGPLPADTIFTQDWLSKADVVVSMFHDQGLPALKALGFGETVNVTLGLPIIRTSVDHGTALDLAGTGKASHSSLMAAVKMAIDLANNRKL